MATFAELPPEIQAQIPEAARGGIVDVQQAPGGGWYALGKDGGVFAVGGSRFRGGLGGTPHLQNIGATAARLEIDPRTGGYTIVADKGARYAFDTEYVSPEQVAERQRAEAERNSIYQDPAYMAFVRGADYSLEEAARQVARRQRALNDNLALRVTDLEQAGGRQRENISNSYEARGVFRSGKRLEDQAYQEQQQARQIETLRRETAGQVAGEQESLASQVAAVQREAGEKGFNVAQTQDLDKRLEGLRQKYPAEFGASMAGS